MHVFVTITVIIAGYLGYRIGRDVGYSKGKSRGSLSTLIEIPLLPEDERQFIFSIAQKGFNAKTEGELRELQNELNNKVPPIIDFTRDMESDPKRRQSAHLLPKYRDILLGELEEGIRSYK